MSVRTVARRLAEGHVLSRRQLLVLPMAPAYRPLRLKLLEDPDWILMTTVYVYGGHMVNALILPLVCSGTPLPHLV